MKTIKIDRDLEVRLDHFLVSELNVSRSFITKGIKDGEILVNNLKVKPGYLLKEDDEITILSVKKEPVNLDPVSIDLDIVYEDDYILVINKQKDLVVHPSDSYKETTLVHGLLFEDINLSSVNGEFRPGIIHRLDKDTTGLLIIAKDNESHKILSKNLADRDIKRYYKALVHGEIKEESGTIDAPIGRHPKVRVKNAVIKSGRSAVTHFTVEKVFNQFTLLDIELETGRTHQIRVHLHFIKHPIVGDALYGAREPFIEDGQLLHAYKLEFTHPHTKKVMIFEIPLPKSFINFLETLE